MNLVLFAQLDTNEIHHSGFLVGSLDVFGDSLGVGDQRDLVEQAALLEGMIQNIAKGRLNKFFKESCLLNQVSLVADPKTVAEYIQAADKEATVVNFVRIKLGE